MSCTNPIYALNLGIQDNGKMKVKILPKRYDLYSREQLYSRYGTSALMALPCGKCLSCLMTRANTWAVRCVLEASLYDQNYFVTLTYDEAHVPFTSFKVKKDFQDFMKRLRKFYPGVRYFACCERGEHTHRLHIHAILFNLPLTDLKLVGKRDVGYCWKSKKLEEIWSKGLTDLGEVTLSSARYVARYAQKKLFNPDAKNDEWLVMSLKPGIAQRYFEEHFQDIYKTDQIYFNFGNKTRVRPPRYFDKLLERIDSQYYEKIKTERTSEMNLSLFDSLIRYNMKHAEDLYVLEANNAIAKFTKMKKRGM